MNFHLNVQPLISREIPAPKSSSRERSYLVTYSHSTGLHRITIKAVDRFAAHDLAKESTPEGMTFTALREVVKPSSRGNRR